MSDMGNRLRRRKASPVGIGHYCQMLSRRPLGTKTDAAGTLSNADRVMDNGGWDRLRGYSPAASVPMSMTKRYFTSDLSMRS
ncbi:hypothetical protein MASR1M101_30970 [Gemmatimonas sp.]